MNRREALFLLPVVAEAVAHPQVAFGEPEPTKQGEPALTGRVFKWTRHGQRSWGAQTREPIRRAAMRIWESSGYNEATERDFLPEECGLYCAVSIRVGQWPGPTAKMGAVLKLPLGAKVEDFYPYMPRLERAAEKSLMFYQVLGTVEPKEFPDAIRQRFPSEDAYVAAIDDWRKRMEWLP